jgi:transposase
MEIRPKPRMIEANRNQFLLRPTDVESLVDDEHAVRAIWEFVGRMDLSRFYASIASIEGEAGRSAWDPKILISIWIYAYSRGIASAREIERRFEYDPAFQWLTGMNVINHHTLSDFRVSGKATLDELFGQVLGLLSADGLITLERVMHDGTKIRAKAGVDTFRREDRIREYLKAAEEQVKAMGEPCKEDLSRRQEKANERVAQERKQKLDLALQELEKIRSSKSNKGAKEQARASVSDPEARIMKQPNGGFGPSYNAQLSTDSANGIVVGVAITQSAADYNELMPALDKIESVLKKLPVQLVVDGGFTSRENIMGADAKGVDLIGSFVNQKDNRNAGQMQRRGIEEGYFANKFNFIPENNSFICPEGKTLYYKGKESRPGKSQRVYQAKTEDCQQCPAKQFCCPNNKQGRSLTKGIDNPVVIAFKEKMETEEAKKIYKKRGPVAEFTNAWIKTKIGLRQFSVQGLKKAEMELQWACLTLNIQQWIRLKHA